MKRDLMFRHGWFPLLGIVYCAYVFWHAIFFGQNLAFSSFRDAPVSRDSILVLAAIFAASLLTLPLLLLIARATRSVMLRALGFLAFAKAYPAVLTLLGILFSIHSLSKRDKILHYCLKKPEPASCALYYRDTFELNRYFSWTERAEIQRMAERGRELQLTGPMRMRVELLYSALQEAYRAEDFALAERVGHELLPMVPASYRDLGFYLRSAHNEKRNSDLRKRQERLAYWRRQPGRGVASLEKEAVRLIPLSRESRQARLELVKVLHEIYDRDPTSAVSRQGMHELGIWERPLR